MADVTPNYSLEFQGLQLEHAQLGLNVQTQMYRIAQIQDEARRINMNIDATKLAMETLATRISEMKVAE